LGHVAAEPVRSFSVAVWVAWIRSSSLESHSSPGRWHQSWGHARRLSLTAALRAAARRVDYSHWRPLDLNIENDDDATSAHLLPRRVRRLIGPVAIE
jgi:hypothetical protein